MRSSCAGSRNACWVRLCRTPFPCSMTSHGCALMKVDCDSNCTLSCVLNDLMEAALVEEG